WASMAPGRVFIAGTENADRSFLRLKPPHRNEESRIWYPPSGSLVDGASLSLDHHFYVPCQLQQRHRWYLVQGPLLPDGMQSRLSLHMGNGQKKQIHLQKQRSRHWMCVAQERVLLRG